MRIGIDLGGTKIEGIALDLNNSIVFRQRVPTPQGDYQGTLRAIADLVREIEKSVGEQSLPVGIGAPGAVSPKTGLIKNSNSLCLIGMPLEKDISLLINRKVMIANDANCFALSENVDGAAMGAEVCFGVILGTGTGGGIVVHRKIVNGANSIAGEWGHNPMPWATQKELAHKCYCGRTACIEGFLAGPSLERDYVENGGAKLAAGEIAKNASVGDRQCVATMKRYVDRLARGLASVINLLDPDVIVLGGGVSNIDSLYVEVPKIWGQYVFSDEISTKLVKNKHGDSSGVRGAAWLTLEPRSVKKEVQ